jgi:hypothetical protein
MLSKRMERRREERKGRKRNSKGNLNKCPYKCTYNIIKEMRGRRKKGREMTYLRGGEKACGERRLRASQRAATGKGKTTKPSLLSSRRERGRDSYPN